MAAANRVDSAPGYLSRLPPAPPLPISRHFSGDSADQHGFTLVFGPLATVNHPHMGRPLCPVDDTGCSIAAQRGFRVRCVLFSGMELRWSADCRRVETHLTGRPGEIGQVLFNHPTRGHYTSTLPELATTPHAGWTRARRVWSRRLHPSLLPEDAARAVAFLLCMLRGRTPGGLPALPVEMAEHTLAQLRVDH
jgi:hypothetical protein